MNRIYIYFVLDLIRSHLNKVVHPNKQQRIYYQIHILRNTKRELPCLRLIVQNLQPARVSYKYKEVFLVLNNLV